MNLLHDLFRAYYAARKNKRKTINALEFEIDYESKLFELYQEIATSLAPLAPSNDDEQQIIDSKKYKIGPSICFITFNPVQREVFAADFRDRIVHHLIYNYVNPIFEKLFINDSYSCRPNKGTSYGIKRVNQFIHSCSQNYQRNCYILKLDIKGYFMAIDKNILWKKIKKEIAASPLAPRNDTAGRQNQSTYKSHRHCEKSEARRSNLFLLITQLLHQITFHNPTKNCRIRGRKSNWKGLPKSKSLFYSGKNKGLPIGNLTSQLFGNVYLSDFDYFVKHKLGCQYYGRYVDDFVIVHQDKEFLKSIIPTIKNYLQKELLLELHPNKIYLQHFSKGVKFLGTIIKPNRIYICNRTKGNFYKAIEKWDKKIADKIASSLPSVAPRNDRGDEAISMSKQKFISCMNSYLGMLKHYNTYKLRRKIVTEKILPKFGDFVFINDDFTVLKLK